MIPAQRLFQIQHGEAGEDNERNHFLNGLEMSRRINRAAPAIGRHREPVFEERDAPTDNDEQRKRALLYFRCPYQAKVMKTFEQNSMRIGKTDDGVVNGMG